VRDLDRLTVAVTGLNATDNPAPGVAVIRALRHDPRWRGRIIGLAYDALDPGVYARDMVDDVFLIPYPSQGVEALEDRLRYIHERVGLDVVLPTLDSELPGFIALAPTLEALGIGTLLPTAEQLELRSKTRLMALGELSGIEVPEVVVLGGPEELVDLHERLPYPFWIKGAFYGATRATNLHEAVRAYHDVVARWGLPVLAQAEVVGTEYDVAGVGDGRGGLVGAVPMRKTLLTDKGKGWAGVAVRDPALLELTGRFVAATRWRGGFEVELVKDGDRQWRLLEVNPRFPAWIYLSAGAGMNLPRAAMRLAAGGSPDLPGGFRAGAMFVRISLDQLADISDYQRLVSEGEIVREDDGGER
jgi:carbamoyl-phosphate synthase large subunit